MYINSSSLEIQNQYADLISPPLLSPGYGNDINITFYYHAYGASSGKLYVYAMYPKYSASLYLLEKISLIARNSWLKASIQFKTNYSDYRIIIRGVVGSKVGSSIAIDDVFIQALVNLNDSILYLTENNCFSHEGQHYRGTIAVTSDGYTCKNWNSDSIISMSLALLNHSIEHDLSSNYCRNPFRNRLKPWCYIESNLTKLSWQYCNVPTCNFSKITVTTYPLGNKYPIKIVQKDGQDKLIGRLAIYYNGRWGILNQTKTTGTIWLRGYDIKCPSYSTDLTQCILGPWNASRCCNHSEDVWIKCSQSNLIGHQPSKAFSNDSYNHSTATIDTIVYRANNEDTYVIGIALGCVIIGIAIIAWLLRYYIKCNQRVSASGGAVQWSANNLTVATATSSVNRPTTTNSSDAELRTMYASSITGVITPISSSNRIASSDASYHALNRSCANHGPQHSRSIQAFQDSSSRSNASFAAPYQPHYDRKMSRMTDVVSLPPSYDAVMKMKFQQRKGRQGNGTTST
ncbi:Hyaluronan-binding protein 2 [Trichoplax sp. H2]|nr:Hyaluronan-binding protein 2 [Trichoplax sp. H2]|eukprot:RDD37232.1 Hyaluronan-binding protein 2 [Trichoplax sp. H2]